ncbi:MAG: AraC family transcriptional regulator [Granulosicoccus sp.]|nr:AraC family transcriptional regulator [Granulosicoccus sp.]
MPTRSGNAFENSVALLSQQLQVDWSAVLERHSGKEFTLEDRSLASRYALWSALEEVYDKTDFPFAVAASAARTPSNFAQLACICSPNLQTALQRASQAGSVFDAMQLSVTESDGMLTISARSTDNSLPMPESMQVALLAYCVEVTRLAADKNFSPNQIMLPEMAAWHSEAAAFFGTEPGVGAPELHIRLDDALMSFRTNHAEVWSVLETRLKLSGSSNLPDSEKVNEVLYALLPSGLSTVEHVAAKLAVSKRTLQRKLSAEGETYQRLLHKTRQQLAHYYLSLADVPVNEIAGLLGYRDPHSFLRAYRGWTGERPMKADPG